YGGAVALHLLGNSRWLHRHGISSQHEGLGTDIVVGNNTKVTMPAIASWIDPPRLWGSGLGVFRQCEAAAISLWHRRAPQRTLLRQQWGWGVPCLAHDPIAKARA